MPKYLIERSVPGASSLSAEDLSVAAAASNRALATLAPRVQWQQSYVAGDKIVCVFIADDQDVVREHARLAGVPADVITEVSTVLDPTSGAR